MKDRDTRIALCLLITLVAYLFLSRPVLTWLSETPQLGLLQKIADVTIENVYGKDSIPTFLFGGGLTLYTVGRTLASLTSEKDTNSSQLAWQIPYAVVAGLAGLGGIAFVWVVAAIIQFWKNPKFR